MNPSLARLLAALCVAATVAACGADGSTSPTGGSPLAGLSLTQTGDTSHTSHPPAGDGPGYFRGTVVGAWDFGSGVDSTVAAPKLAGIVVTIYQLKANGDAGDAKGSVTTGADGKFVLPTVPAGDYAVSFVPPAGSAYRASYAVSTICSNSSEYPWFVVLMKK